jgi:hypothetical protein
MLETKERRLQLSVCLLSVCVLILSALCYLLNGDLTWSEMEQRAAVQALAEEKRVHQDDMARITTLEGQLDYEKSAVAYAEGIAAQAAQGTNAAPGKVVKSRVKQGKQGEQEWTTKVHRLRGRE